MVNQYLITIKDMKTEEERRGVVYANSLYVALVRFANQITMGTVAKLIPKRGDTP